MATLQEKIAELRSIDGCLGGFASVEGRCIASSLPPVYDQQRLDRVAAALRKLAAISEKSGQPQADFVIALGKATLLNIALGGTGYLSLACDADANIATVEIFAGVAADDIREAIAALPPAALAPPPAAAEPARPQPPIATPTSPQRPSLEAVRGEARRVLGAKLDLIRSLFVREVGPIGELLFTEALDAWLLAGPVGWARISELRDRLAAEIDSGPDRVRFSKDSVWK